MSSPLHVIVRSGWITRIVAMTALVVTGDTTPAEAAEPDYHLNLHVPPQFVVCKDKSWFDSRLALIRGEETFSSPTDIDVTVTSHEGSGLGLKVALRSAVDGTEMRSKEVSYVAPIECTHVVADAAEIAAQMMRNREPGPQPAPTTYDYEVAIDAPDSLAACRNTEQWRKFFEYARGEERFLAPWRKRVELKFEGDLTSELVVWITLRGPDGYPILGPEGTRLDKVRRAYARPLECTRGLANAAHSVANLIHQPSLPPAPHEPLKPTLERHPSFSFNVVNYTNIFYKHFGFGAQMMLDLPLQSQFSLRVSAIALHPLLWSLKSRPPDEPSYDFGSSGMGIAALDLCYGPELVRSCIRSNMGIVHLMAVGAAIARSPFVSHVSFGPHLSIASRPFNVIEYGKFQLQLDGGFYVHAVPSEVTITIIDGNLAKFTRKLERPTWASGSFGIGVRYTF